MQQIGFDPWVGEIPWRKAWQTTPVFLPEESLGQRSLVGYWSTLVLQRVRHDLVTKQQKQKISYSFPPHLNKI